MICFFFFDELTTCRHLAFFSCALLVMYLINATPITQVLTLASLSTLGATFPLNISEAAPNLGRYGRLFPESEDFPKTKQKKNQFFTDRTQRLLVTLLLRRMIWGVPMMRGPSKVRRAKGVHVSMSTCREKGLRLRQHQVLQVGQRVTSHQLVPPSHPLDQNNMVKN